MPADSEGTVNMLLQFSSYVEFSLVAVKALWFYVPETPLFMDEFWFVPIGGACLGPI